MCCSESVQRYSDMSRLIALLGQGFPCPFKYVTGFYCPGCGGTRAVWYLLHGHILLSIQYHPLVFYMALMIVVESVGYLLAKRTGKTWMYMGRYGLVISLGVAIVLINWVFKNYMLVARGIDLLPGKLF